MPGFRAVTSYRREWLVKDIVAGVVLTTLLVPQGMAYAELAGLPAITGLYTSILCLLGYAVFGPSRILVLGPDSSVAGRPLYELRLPVDSAVVAIVREGHVVIPQPETVLTPGDEIMAIASADAEPELLKALA